MSDTELLMKYYNEHMKVGMMPPFVELSTDQKRYIKESLGFARYKLSCELQQLKVDVLSIIPQPIRWILKKKNGLF